MLTNYNELCRQIEANGYIDPHLKEDLRIDMQNGKQLIELFPRDGGFRINDDQVNYMLTVSRYRKGYVWDGAAVVLHRNLPIRHCTINGLNTSELEQRMKPIDWMRDYGALHKANGNNPEVAKTLSKVTAILDDLLALQSTGGDRGIDISLQLIQRYVMAGPNGVAHNLHAYMLQLSPPLSHFFDMTAQPFTFREAYHLLSSRAVRKKIHDPVQGTNFQWFRLNLDPRGFGDPSEMLQYPDFNLLPQLAKLPCPEINGPLLHQCKRILHAGDLLYLTSPAGPVTVTVDPAQRVLYGLNDYLEPISHAALLRRFDPTNVFLQKKGPPVFRNVRFPRTLKGVPLRNPFGKRGPPRQ